LNESISEASGIIITVLLLERLLRCWLLERDCWYS